MSTSVDNRIVQLTFDNKQFEQEVKQSMNSLKQLEETIKGAGSSKAAEKLGEGFNKLGNVRFEEMAKSVDAIKKRFSTLGIVGMTVIQNLTDKAMSFVGKGLGALKDALFTGGWQRAANLEQAKFRLEAIVGSAKKVKEVMDDVDWAVTGTSYGLDEAAVSASMFAATGIKAGKDMKTALRAVAGIAATFGQDFQQVSTVMTDAAASGNMMNDAMSRLTMLGVPAIRIMADYLGVADSQVKKLAQDGKISFKQLAEAMDDAFGEHAQDANKTFDGALANMKTALKRMTEPFYTDLRTGLRRIFNAMKELFKGIADEMLKNSPMLDAFHKYRKYFTDNIIAFISDIQTVYEKGNPFKDTGKAFSVPVATVKILMNLFSGLVNIARQLRDGFNEVFDVRFSHEVKYFANSILDVTKKFKIWTAESSAFQTASRIFFKALQTIGVVINFVIQQLKGLYKIFKSIADFMRPVVDVIMSVTNGFRNMLFTITNYLNQADIFGKIANALRRGFDFILAAFGAAGTAVIDFLKNLGNAMTSSFEDFIKFVLALGILKRLKQAKTFFTTLSATAESFNVFLQDLNKTVDAIIKIPQKISNILTQIRKSLVEWQKSLKVAQLLGIAGGLYITALAIQKLEKLKGDQVATILTTIAGSLIFLTSALVVLDKVFSVKGDKIKKPSNLYDVLDSLVAHLPGGGEDPLKQAGKTMLMIAGSVLILAKAMETLGKLDKEQLIQGGIAITAMMLVLTGITKFLSGKENTKMAKGMTGLIAMAVSVKILGTVLKDLSEIPWDRLQESLSALALVLGMVAGYAILMSRGGAGSEPAKVKSFILMAISMKILGNALADLAEIDWDSMTHALTAMFFVLAMLAGFSHATKGVGTGGAGLIMAAASMVLIAHALQQLAQVPYDSLQQLGGVLILIFATLGAAMAVASKFLLGAAALVVVAGALNLLIIPLVTLSAIPIDNLMHGLLGMATALAIVGVGMAVFGAAIGPIVAGSIALASASVSLLIFAAACAALGAAFSMLAVGVAAVWKVLKTILTDIVKVLKWIWNKISTFIDKITGSTEKINSKKMTKNTSKIGKDVAASLGKGFAGAIPGLIKAFLTGGLQVIGGLAKGVGQKIKDIPKMIKEKIQEAKDKVTGERGGFESAGGSLVSGIASGIRGGLSSIISATGSIASRALNHFKEKLGISSPSKEFMKASSWIPAGIVKGLKMNAFRVNREVDSLSYSMLNTMQEAISKSYDMLNDNGDLNPVITPSLDLTQIQNGIGNMQSLFSDRQISASIRAREINGTFNGTTTDALLNKVIRTISEQAKAAENHFSNTFNVNGGVNPEDFATRVARRLEMEMRV